jgi:Protein of unknown function (DUF1569)
MHTEKLHFIQHDFIQLLSNLQAAATGKWGKMNGQQMVEHLSFIFSASSGKIKTTLAIPEEFLPKAKAFLWSDKEFRENTKAPAGLIPEEPQPLQHATMDAAIAELKEEVNYFVDYFQHNPGITTMHPAFGALNFEEWVQIHHKHLVHHLKQFELM